MSTAETNLQYEEGASLWTDAWRRLAQNRMAVIATVIFGLIILLCLIGPLLFGQHSGETNNLENAFQSHDLRPDNPRHGQPFHKTDGDKKQNEISAEHHHEHDYENGKRQRIENVDDAH